MFVGDKDKNAGSWYRFKDGNVTYYVKTMELAKTDDKEDPGKLPVIILSYG